MPDIKKTLEEEKKTVNIKKEISMSPTKSLFKDNIE